MGVSVLIVSFFHFFRNLRLYNLDLDVTLQNRNLVHWTPPGTGRENRVNFQSVQMPLN